MHVSPILIRISISHRCFRRISINANVLAFVVAVIIRHNIAGVFFRPAVRTALGSALTTRRARRAVHSPYARYHRNIGNGHFAHGACDRIVVHAIDVSHAVAGRLIFGSVQVAAGLAIVVVIRSHLGIHWHAQAIVAASVVTVIGTRQRKTRL